MIIILIIFQYSTYLRVVMPLSAKAIDVLFSYIVNKFFNNIQIFKLKEDILDSQYFKIKQ